MLLWTWGRFLIETHPRTGRPIKELAAAHDVSARWLFKLLRRYRLEGAAGLELRSWLPKTSPTRIADLYEDEIMALHKALADDGLDAGAATIHFHLAQRSTRPPSVSTFFRVLKAEGVRHPRTEEASDKLVQEVRRRPAK